jgi:hypothetical protein
LGSCRSHDASLLNGVVVTDSLVTQHWATSTSEGIPPQRRFLLTNPLYNLSGQSVTAAWPRFVSPR